MPAGFPDPRWMDVALRLAWRAQGLAEPNPMVGAVLVRDGQPIGMGHHQRFGEPHAEVEALADARRRGVDPRGADLYVTLEPCCHFGKTPPCSDAVIAAGVARVAMAMVDPDPRVDARGASQLRAAGIQVHVGLREEQARRLIAGFISRLERGRPWVIAKWAQTLDGAVASASGHSRWVSSATSRRWVHRIRGRVDAVITGVGTVRADDAMLTPRQAPARRTPRRVVIDPRLSIDPGCVLLGSIDEGPISLAHAPPPDDPATRGAWRQRHDHLLGLGVELIELPFDGGICEPGAPSPADDVVSASANAPVPARPKLLLRPLLEHLQIAHDATHVMIEAGPMLTGEAIRQGMVDQALVFVAPRLLGDPAGLPPANVGPAQRMTDAVAMRLRKIRRLGDDLALLYDLFAVDGARPSPPQLSKEASRPDA